MGEVAEDYDWLPGALDAIGRSTDLVAPERRSFPIPDGAISALIWGDPDDAPVLLHGGGQNAHTWDVVAALLGGAIAIDLPGHGHSAWREDRDYRPYTSARAIASVLDQLGGPRRIVGMSHGGLTSIALADRRPELVPSLAIVDILPSVGLDAPPVARDDLGQVSLLYGPREFDTFDEMVQTVLAVATGRSRETLERGVRHNAKQLSTGRWVWRYDSLRTARADEEQTAAMWRTLEHPRPLMIVRGGESAFVSDAAVDRLASANPRARVEVVEGAGHAVQSVKPIELAALLTSFWRES